VRKDLVIISQSIDNIQVTEHMNFRDVHFSPIPKVAMWHNAA
jgi:hypothetical protein